MNDHQNNNPVATETKAAENCPQCERELIGVIEVATAEIAGISIMTMTETPDRNWILCDLCNRTVCKNCCVMPDSGYCDTCFFKLKIVPYLP